MTRRSRSARRNAIGRLVVAGLLLAGLLAAGCAKDDADGGSLSGLTAADLEAVCDGTGDPRFPAFQGPGAEGDADAPIAVVRRDPSGPVEVRGLGEDAARADDEGFDAGDHPLVACVTHTGELPDRPPTRCLFDAGVIVELQAAGYHLSLREARTGTELHSADWEVPVGRCPEQLPRNAPTTQPAWAEADLAAAVASFVG